MIRLLITNLEIVSLLYLNGNLLDYYKSETGVSYIEITLKLSHIRGELSEVIRRVYESKLMYNIEIDNQEINCLKNLQ